MIRFYNFIRISFLLIGDLFSFYLALFLAVLLRYNFSFRKEIFISASNYFAIVFLFWLIFFLIGRLYELLYTVNRKEFFERALKIFAINAVFASVYFYLFTASYRPSLSLILTIAISCLIFIFWRAFAHKILRFSYVRLLIISQKKEAEIINQILNKNPQTGYKIHALVSFKEFTQRKEELLKSAPSLIVSDQLNLGLVSDKKVVTLEEFYESITGKVSLNLISGNWFALFDESAFQKTKKQIFARKWMVYDFIKRALDIIGGIILLVISFPLWPIIAFLIKFGSEGPIFYRSLRVGQHKKKFYIYKFRTMIKEASKLGPFWTLKNDFRITRLGKFLRLIHLDEMPQVLNIVKGDISFVGPRPEEAKLVELFEKTIPFYKYRFLMKPGVIGWAQINYPHGASIEDAKHKLEYDFYYLKHRNFFFDLIVALKAWRIPFEIPTH